jgi:hypothetical protein
MMASFSSIIKVNGKKLLPDSSIQARIMVRVG